MQHRENAHLAKALIGQACEQQHIVRDQLTVHELRRVADELNDRPRKTLGWCRPGDLFQSALAAA